MSDSVDLCENLAKSSSAVNRTHITGVTARHQTSAVPVGQRKLAAQGGRNISIGSNESSRNTLLPNYEASSAEAIKFPNPP